MPNNVRIGTQVTGVGKSSSDLDKLRDRFDKLQKQGAKGFAIGAGAAITAKGLSLMGDAAGAAMNALGDMVQGAMADETSLAKLTTAIKENVKGWDGNSAAIEKVISGRMKLGFADDVQRESLALLVAKTGDVTEALNIQRVAMDLARLKSISLAEASKAIALGMSGQGRALKDLGINVKELTSKQEVLGAIQAKAAGQAKAFGDTTAGALETMNVAIEEAGESIGTDLLPMIKDLAVFVAEDAVPALVDFKDAAGKLGEMLEDLPKSGDEGWHGWATRQAKVRADFLLTQIGVETLGNGITRNLRDKAAGALDDFASRGGRVARTVGKSLDSIADDFDTTWSELSGAADQAAEDIFGPMERRAELVANRIAQSGAMGEINKPRQKDETGTEYAERIAGARQDLLGLQKDFFALTAEMAGRGELTARELSKLTAALKEEMKTASLEEQTSILKLLVLLDKLTGKAATYNLGPAAGSGQAGGGSGRIGPDGRKVNARGVVGTTNGATDLGWAGEAGNEAVAIIRNPKPITGGGVAAVGMGDTSAILSALNTQTAYLARIAAGEPHAASPMTARGDLARQSALMPGGRL